MLKKIQYWCILQYMLNIMICMYSWSKLQLNNLRPVNLDVSQNVIEVKIQYVYFSSYPWFLNSTLVCEADLHFLLDLLVLSTSILLIKVFRVL